MHLKSKINVKIISFLRECFLTKKNPFRSPIKYFELAPLRVGPVGRRQTNNFLSPVLWSKKFQSKSFTDTSFVCLHVSVRFM